MSKPKCYQCSTELDLPPGIIGRNEECPKCRADVKVCLNCSFYDLSSYNECREPSAERVVDKSKANFCDYFSMRTDGQDAIKNNKEEALNKLDELFKK